MSFLHIKGRAARFKSHATPMSFAHIWLFPNAGFGFVAPNVGLLFVGAGSSGIYYTLTYAYARYGEQAFLKALVGGANWRNIYLFHNAVIILISDYFTKTFLPLRI